MLDFSFGELMVIGAVALIALGPERLPRVARTFGELLGKAQRYLAQVRSEFQREIELADLKRVQEEARQAAASLQSSFRQVAGSVQSAADQASTEMSAAEASVAATSRSGSPEWGSGGWSTHRFRTRARPMPSIDDLAEAVERLQARQRPSPRGVVAGLAGLGRNRYAPRSRVNRPRIYR